MKRSSRGVAKLVEQILDDLMTGQVGNNFKTIHTSLPFWQASMQSLKNKIVPLLDVPNHAVPPLASD